MVPRVSVVIPTYNRPALLREALTSVAAQTYTDYEIVVVDDGSTIEGAEAICCEFSRCHYIRQPNQGLSATRNRGIRESRGELIALLDDDDKWKPTKLAKQVSFLDSNPEVAVVHGPAQIIEADGTETVELTGDNNPERRSGEVFVYALQAGIVKSPTPLARRVVFDECGYFDERLRQLYLSEDVEFWARVAYKFRFGHIAEPLAYYRRHQGQTPQEDRKRNLQAYTYIAQKLSDYVDASDRRTVLRYSAAAYVHAIGKMTSPHSLQRVYHLAKALRLWPLCFLWKQYWGVAVLPR